MPRRVADRFDGRILGAGSTSGVRVVVGDWARSPLRAPGDPHGPGAFTDVMVATAEHRRVLLAPDEQVADYVTATYHFDEVVLTPVLLDVAPDEGGSRWVLDAGPLRCAVTIGGRTGTGRLLRAVPSPVARSRLLAVLADPVARRVHPGVRTYGSAGGGRREYYSALDQWAVLSIEGMWRGDALGDLATVSPAPRFGFSSTPATPALTRVVTTVVRPPSLS